MDPRVLIRIKLKLLIYKQEESKGHKKVQIAKTARWRAQKRPRYVAPGTDCSPGSYAVKLVQI